MGAISAAIIRSTFLSGARNLSSKLRRIKDMTKRTIIFAAAALLVVGLAVPFAYAQHMRARGMGMHGARGDFAGTMMLGRLARAQQQLGLSDQQVADIKAIFKDLRAQNATYRDQLHGNFKSVAAALIANPNDIAAA